MTRVTIKPELIRWACERSRIPELSLKEHFPKLSEWINGEKQPTIKQLEKFAKVTHTPFGFLFYPEPPDEPMPIPDFRKLKDAAQGRPSPDLLDTIYAMQYRQEWLREERIEGEADPLDFVGSARLHDNPIAIGQEMRRIVGVSEGWTGPVHTWQDAINELRRLMEKMGVIAVINGVVGNNTHRKLSVNEFRGFALADNYAPLIFVNGADAKSAQMFTLAHELAHLWLGSIGDGISGFADIFPEATKVEKFCDQAASEFLVPEKELRAAWREAKNVSAPFKTLARQFKVSPIVIGRRAMDLRLVGKETFFSYYNEYKQHEHSLAKKSSGGGDFYHNQNSRIGANFATLVIRAAKEGRLTFKEAYHLTGLHGGAFQEYARRLGVYLP
ncbi:MAG: ImmA/IrrE family metallo-endopeptidase [Deltaproteobacteria bacterium]|nr:ImmA/IrrE family metallo-endopeptidase [Deltaproteobacteria bacterium]